MPRLRTTPSILHDLRLTSNPDKNRRPGPSSSDPHSVSLPVPVVLNDDHLDLLFRGCATDRREERTTSRTTHEGAPDSTSTEGFVDLPTPLPFTELPNPGRDEPELPVYRVWNPSYQDGVDHDLRTEDPPDNQPPLAETVYSTVYLYCGVTEFPVNTSGLIFTYSSRIGYSFTVWSLSELPPRCPTLPDQGTDGGRRVPHRRWSEGPDPSLVGVLTPSRREGNTLGDKRFPHLYVHQTREGGTKDPTSSGLSRALAPLLRREAFLWICVPD